MESLVDLVSSSTDPRARARFQNLQLKKKVKAFRVQMRGYKRPDFNRMILDLCKLGWTHEKIAFVLPVANASTVSEWEHGGKPNYENGDAFIELWMALTDKTVKDIPRNYNWGI